MKTYARLRQYLAEILKWEVFQAKFVEKMKTNI
jgi:hypothetical protein